MKIKFQEINYEPIDVTSYLNLILNLNIMSFPCYKDIFNIFTVMLSLVIIYFSTCNILNFKYNDGMNINKNNIKIKSN